MFPLLDAAHLSMTRKFRDDRIDRCLKKLTNFS